MRTLPSRTDLAALEAPVKAVAATIAIGFVRPLGHDRVSILHVRPHGMSGYEVGASDLPYVMRPEGEELRQADAAIIGANPQRPSRRRSPSPST